VFSDSPASGLKRLSWRMTPAYRNALLLVICTLPMVHKARAQERFRRQQFVDMLGETARRDSADVRQFLTRRQVPDRGIRGGISFELVRIQNGRPIYAATHNVAAAHAAGVPEVRIGGWVGVDYHGQGMTVGIWDAGTALPEHVEFGGRVSVLDTSFPPATHATHVSGTVVAAGVRPEAQGVADGALIVARDWQNDEVEMAQAGADGLRLSNHSYGTFGGWVKDLRGTGRWTWMGDPSVSASEDFRFGFYDEQASEWDAIAFASPNHVIVKSAGNDRGDRGPLPGSPYDFFDSGWMVSTALREPDGGETGYDSILDAGVAKNVITVGAVEDLAGRYEGPSDVVMTSFSSWGPTDDGRIKPDLVANGTSVLSPVAGWNEAYAYSSGTSMAAPVVTGVVALVQEAFLRSGRVPRSAAIRALLIHTADEAGPADGPDYQFGWGLVNAARAVALVEDERLVPGRMVTDALQPGESRSYPLDVPPGTPLEATLAWTDPPAPPGELGLNARFPKLVSDLDLRIEGPGGPWLPYVLDPDAPGQPARMGVNRVDNVERVKTQTPTGGPFEVIVTLAPDAPATQEYTLILGAAPSGNRSTRSLSGRLQLAGKPLKGIAVSAGSLSVTSAADGSFFFPSLPSGPVTVTPDPGFRFEPTSAILQIPGDSFISFNARSEVAVVGLELFSSSRLLQSDEGQHLIPVGAAASGGVYGLNVFLATGGGTDLSGGRLVAEFDGSPFTSSYAGDRSLAWRQSSPIWKITASGADRFWKRFPLLWIAPDSVGRVRLPVQIFDAAARLVGIDTLSWSVDRADDVPPNIFTRLDIAGRGFAEPGGDLIIRADIVDGSPIAGVSASLRLRGDERALDVIPFFDDGAWSKHADAVAGDRLYSTIYSPRIPEDFAVDLRASDRHGNESVYRDFWHFSSRKFIRESKYLLLTWSQVETDTDAQRLGLDAASVAHDSWEFDIRGQIPDSILYSYSGVISSWETMPISRTQDQAQLERLTSAGIPLVIVGSRIGPSAWLNGLTGYETAASVRGSVVTGDARDSTWRDLSFDLPLASTLPAWRVPANARSILMSEGQSVAASTGSLVISGLSPLQLAPEDRGPYLRALLSTATGDPELAGQPTGVAESSVPGRPELDPPYPNPSSGNARIGFRLSQTSPVRLTAYDLLGRRVLRLERSRLPPGRHTETLNVSALPAGVYMIVLAASGATLHDVMVVVH
jgi:Subtilase family/Secretion system C-terminal sorting domain